MNKMIVLSLTLIASIAFADDSANVNPDGGIGGYTPSDKFAGACPNCFIEADVQKTPPGKYDDLLAGDASSGKNDAKGAADTHQ